MMMRATALDVIEQRAGEACMVGCPLCGALIKRLTFTWSRLHIECESGHPLNLNLSRLCLHGEGVTTLGGKGSGPRLLPR